MFIVEELVTQYEAYSDKELYDVHKNIEGYSAEAKEALEKVIRKRGGLESLLARLKDEQRVEMEKIKLIAEVGMLTRKGVDASFIRTAIQSTILSPQQVSKIIDDTYRQVKLEVDDQKIKPRTIAGSLIGTVLATITGGALWGLRLIYGPPETEIRIHLICNHWNEII